MLFGGEADDGAALMAALIGCWTTLAGGWWLRLADPTGVEEKV